MSGEFSKVTADTKPETKNDIHSRSGTCSDPADGGGNDDPEGITQHSRRQSTGLGPALKVARLKRRGLFGQITLVAEVENPKTYSRNMKWLITFNVALAGSAAPLGSSIIFCKSLYDFVFVLLCLINRPLASLSQVTKEFGTTTTIANLSIAFYLLSMSIFPLWWSSFSERLGRRTIYLASFSLFVVFNCICAISSSIEMFIIMRMLSGGASASVQALGAGSIADIWDSRERGRAMGIFFLGPLCGPLFAPIIGGLLAQRWGWRSTMWFLALFGAFTLIFVMLFLPETLTVRKPFEDSEYSATSRQVVRSTTRWLRVLKTIFVDPLRIILYLQFFPVLLSVYYGGITFGSLYVLNVSIEQTFAKAPYNFSTIPIGLLYIPNSLGYILASIFGGRWMDSIMHREAKKANRYDEEGRLLLRSEDRMRENAWLGAFLYPGALIWYGWATQNGVFWLVPVCRY